MATFTPIEGFVTNITLMQTGSAPTTGCTLLMTLRSRELGIYNFVIDGNTYILNNVNIRRGDRVIAYYDYSAPAPLINPPQFRAVVIARPGRGEFVMVDEFDQNLLNSEGTLRLNIAPTTRILLENGMTYPSRDITNRMLTVVYSSTTRSIPAMTTPSQVVVMCR